MIRNGWATKGVKGSSIAEFAVVAGVFFMIIIGIIEFGRLFHTHNALTDATRRGARFAVLRQQDVACVKNAVVYGETHLDANCTPVTGASPLIHGLSVSHVSVSYDAFELNKGTATVSITGYTFTLGIPFLHRNLAMPSYAATLTAESAGIKPPNITSP
jgi:hypothetical protein